MIREFGNTWDYFKKLLLFSLALGVVAGGLMAWVLIRQNKSDRLINAVVGGLAVGGVIPLFVSPTLLFSIRIGDGAISHVLCRRWVLKRRPLAGLTRVEIGFGAGAKFRFADNPRSLF